VKRPIIEGGELMITDDERPSTMESQIRINSPAKRGNLVAVRDEKGVN
jgi:hypothetical protein